LWAVLQKLTQSVKKRTENSDCTAQYQQFSPLLWAVSRGAENHGRKAKGFAQGTFLLGLGTYIRKVRSNMLQIALPFAENGLNDHTVLHRYDRTLEKVGVSCMRNLLLP